LALRTVLAGCGAMSHGWLKACARIADIEIVGLVDLDPARAHALATEFSLANIVVGSDLDTVLGDVKPDLLFDVVVPSARPAVVELGLRHGCHVLSEKPMAENLALAKTMIANAQKFNRLHAVVQNRRYLDGVRRIRRFIEAGHIGRLTSLHCDFFLGPHFGGFREQMQHVLLLDMAIHTFDAARYMADKVPLAVYCHETNPPGSWYAQGASAAAIFEFSDQVTFTYRGSWCAEGLRTSWEGLWRFIGDKGSLTWNGENEFLAESSLANGEFFSPVTSIEVPPRDPQVRVDGHYGVIADFVSAVKTGVQPETAGHDNIRSLAMALAAIASAESHQRVEIEQDF
jgi:predicted dehydrogenase